jgi:hypothetical protein
MANSLRGMNDDEWEAMLKRVAERQGRSAPSPVTTANFHRLPTIVASERPQPIDYGLTHDDLNLYDNSRTWWWCELPAALRRKYEAPTFR